MTSPDTPQPRADDDAERSYQNHARRIAADVLGLWEDEQGAVGPDTDPSFDSLELAISRAIEQFAIEAAYSSDAALREAREEAAEYRHHWLAVIGERDSAQEDVERLLKVIAAAAEELRLIRMKDTSVVYNPALHTQIALALARSQSTTPSPVPHPWYGPCDSLAENGDCAECRKFAPSPGATDGGTDAPINRIAVTNLLSRTHAALRTVDAMPDDHRVAERVSDAIAAIEEFARERGITLTGGDFE